MRFITNYRRLNRQLVRKTYPLTIMINTIQHLEGFQYATALDINTGYYTIRLLPASQDMTTIVTAVGKLRYNILPMDMCYSRYIYFKAKVENLLGGIKGVKTHIDDIPISRKKLFKKHIDHRRIIFGRLRTAGLMV